MLLEFGYVKPMVAVAVELNGLPGDLQKGGIGLLVADDLAKVKGGLGQVAPGGLLRLIGPEEADKGVSAVRPAGLNGQADQQRPHLVGIQKR